MAAKSVVLVDSGGTNIGSVRFALERLGCAAVMTADADTIRAASHVILPGVGAAAAGMRKLHASGLVPVLRSLTQPVLGVCLGMQLLFDRSDEGDVACLGIIPGRVRRLQAKAGLRIPHMGWNALLPERESALLDGVAHDGQAYFVHSYAAEQGPWTVASCEHGQRFPAMVQQRNFHGAQFHPERSASLGARILKNFLEL